VSEIDQCYIHLNAAYLAFGAGNYAQSKRELAEARTVYHAKPRGVPPRGVWCDAFDDIVILRGKLANAEKQRTNPKNIHFDGYDFAIEGGRYKRVSGDDVVALPTSKKKQSGRSRDAVKAEPVSKRPEKYSREFQVDSWTNAKGHLRSSTESLRGFLLTGSSHYLKMAKAALAGARWSNTVIHASSLYNPEEKAQIRKEISEVARKLKAEEAQPRTNPMRRNHHLKPGMRALGSVKVIKSLGLQKSGEDLYLVDGRKLRKVRK